jgi:hypothetical protein
MDVMACCLAAPLLLLLLLLPEGVRSRGATLLRPTTSCA